MSGLVLPGSVAYAAPRPVFDLVAAALAKSAIVELTRSEGMAVIRSSNGTLQIVLPFEPSQESRLKTAKAWRRASEIRQGVLGDEFGADPVWDMLLHIYVNQHDHGPVSVSSAGTASALRVSTALR